MHNESIQHRAERLSDPRTEADYREAADLIFLHGGWVRLTEHLKQQARFTYSHQASLAIVKAARDLCCALTQGAVVCHDHEKAKADPAFQQFLGTLDLKS